MPHPSRIALRRRSARPRRGARRGVRRPASRSRPTRSAALGPARPRRRGRSPPYAVGSARDCAARSITPHPALARRSPRRPRRPQRAAERAFTTIAALADMLIACLHAPLARTGRGWSAPSTAGGSSSRASCRIRRGRRAGRCSPQTRRPRCGALERECGSSPSRARGGCASPPPRAGQTSPRACATRCRAGLRTADGGWVDPRRVGRAPIRSIPRGPLRAAAAAPHRRALGPASPTTAASRPWAAPLRTGADAATRRRCRRSSPPRSTASTCRPTSPRSRPGPLAPALDLRLRGIAVRESRAQASTYRFTAESLGAGMTEGETAESMREFLAELSLTGIPQPLEYLIETHRPPPRAGARGRGRRLRPHAGRERRPGAARDDRGRPGAAPARARPRDGGLLARASARDAVYWSLADARYPVVAVDAGGRPEAAAPPTALGPAARPTATPAHDPLRRRWSRTLRGGQGTDAERRGSAASSSRRCAPDVDRRGGGADAGRLRARVHPRGDAASAADACAAATAGADIERTLPVSSIVSVRRCA